jgi:hypothetical protein
VRDAETLFVGLHLYERLVRSSSMNETTTQMYLAIIPSSLGVIISGHDC